MSKLSSPKRRGKRLMEKSQLPKFYEIAVGARLDFVDEGERVELHLCAVTRLFENRLRLLSAFRGMDHVLLKGQLISRTSKSSGGPRGRRTCR